MMVEIKLKRLTKTKNGIRRSQTSREDVMMRKDSFSEVLRVEPEGDGGVGGAAGMKKAGMQTMVF